MRNNNRLTVCTDKRLTPIIAKICKEVRQRNEISLTQMSEITNIEYNTLSAFEMGRSRNGHIIFSYIMVFYDDLLEYDFAEFIDSVNTFKEEY